MATQTVSSWTPVIKRGGVLRKTISFKDEAGTPIPYTDFEIPIVDENGSPLVTWSVGNGQITFVGTGVYTLFVDAPETTGYSWSYGTYRFSVTDGSGNPVPCLTEGKVFVENC